MKILKPTTFFTQLALAVFVLAGCALPNFPNLLSLKEPTMAVPFDSMPLEAATITSALAIQALTPPLESTGNIRFDEGVNGCSEVLMALEGFVFTDGVLYAYRPAVNGRNGIVAGKLGFSDPFDRQADFLFLAEYEKDGEAYVVHSIKITPKYADAPRMHLFVIPRKEIPLEPNIATYGDFVALLADKAVSPAVYKRSSGMADYVIIAMGADRVAPDATLALGVSARRADISSYTADSKMYCYNGWPVAILAGRMNPAGTPELFAKVTFQQAQAGIFTATKLLCVHQLSGFKD